MEEFEAQVSAERSMKHLNKDVVPIMACIGTREDFNEEPGLTDHLGFYGEDPQTLLVDYFEDSSVNEAKGIKNFGAKTYAISEISPVDKFSLRYKNCTGIVVSGQDRTTGRNISFFTHQDPTKILPEGTVGDHFLMDVKARLREMCDRSVPGTIDAIIFGGNYLDSEEMDKLRDKTFGVKTEFEENYKDSIRFLSKQIVDVLGFEPTVIAGPKTTDGSDDVIYDNENRRLYLRRPKIGDTSAESFSPQDLDKRAAEWGKEWN